MSSEDSDPNGEAGASWRDRDRTFRQGDAFGGPASDDARPDDDPSASRSPAAPASQAMTAYVGGAAMVGTTILALLIGAPALLAFGLGLVAFAGVVMFRRKPRTGARGPRAIADAIGVDAAAVTEALTEADARLDRIEAAARRLEPRAVGDALLGMARAARAVVDDVEQDPADFDRARKFFRVYLPSSEDAVRKFEGLGVRDAELDRRFEALVADMTEAAERQRVALQADDKLDFEVELEVLSERLRAETGGR